MKITRFLSSLLFFFTCTSVFSQMSFRRNDSILVLSGTDTLINAWTGGLNFCQFSEIDLNLDGINDLFVFDRQGTNGGRVTTFLNKGTPNTVSYVNAPEYAGKFPILQNWALLADYNCDGKADIFTSTNGGIMLYKNTSTVAGGLSFQLVNPLLHSNYGSGIYNLYVSPTDMPAILDLDGDGDIDILTYTILTKYIEFHKNMSVETYGTCDSLNAWVKDPNCYGDFVDNGNVCTGYISTNLGPCQVSSPPPPSVNDSSGGLKHQGNCILCLQEEGKNKEDIVLGHVGCTGLTEMKNTGRSDSAVFVSPDYTFPSYDVPVNMNIFTCGFLVDVDNDGKKDVLVSPNNQQEGGAEDFNSVGWYKNMKSTDSTILHFQQNNFLQDRMIDVGEGAFPVLRDYDGDGLADLFIGNYGYFNAAQQKVIPQIALFKNTGTNTHPVFSLVTRDFARLSCLNLHLTQFAPTFGDLDGDGDADMVIGDYQGHLYYFEKSPAAPDSFIYHPNYFPSSWTVGNAASPQLIDLNRDGLLDLVVGSRTGKIFYYQNTGTVTSPSFASAPTSNALGGVSTVRPGYTTGYAAPFFYDEAGSYKLLVGAESGSIQKYGNIDGNLSGTFTLLDPLVAWIGEGERAVPYGYDINADGLMDLFVGNFSGGLEFYQGSNAVGIVNLPARPDFGFELSPNPAGTFCDLVISGFNPGDTYTFLLTDLAGRTIRGTSLTTAGNRISTTELPAGVYLCNVYSDTGVVHHKLIVGN